MEESNFHWCWNGFRTIPRVLAIKRNDHQGKWILSNNLIILWLPKKQQRLHLQGRNPWVVKGADHQQITPSILKRGKKCII